MIIGISGKIGTGKTTLANLLLDRLPGYKRWAFGGILKQEAAKRFNFPLKYCYDKKDAPIFHHDLPNNPMTVRQILQWWGTDVRRQQDPDYWVKLMRPILRDNPCTIVDDVRFPNEAELIRELDGLLIRIKPYPGWPGWRQASVHPSETALDKWADWDKVIKPLYGQLPEKADELVEEFFPF